MISAVKKKDKRALAIAIVFSLLFSLGMHFGYAVDKTEGLMVSSPLWWLSMVASWIAITVIVYFLLLLLGGDFKKEKAQETPTLVKPVLFKDKKAFVFAWIIILLFWLPVFLAEYPGFFVYDATDEYVEVATRTFSTHHPLLHVLMLGGSVCAGNKLTGDYNTGIAMYILFQMLMVSGIFGRVISQIYRESKRLITGYVLPLIWYGLFPVVVMFALCSVKDTLFAAFMLASVVLTVNIFKELINGEAENRISAVRKDIIILGISLIGMLLMRRNGVYGFLVYGVVCVVFGATLQKKSQIKAKTKPAGAGMILCFMLCVFAGYFLTDTALKLATSASDEENQEILTVPIQQLARTWRVYGDELSEEDISLLYEVLPEEALRRYTPVLSDPVKVDFNNSAYEANKSAYISLWWRLLKEHPLSYINAWLNTSYGYYYPPVIVNAYAGHSVYTFTYTESSYFGYEVEYPGSRKSLIPQIDGFYRWLSLDDDIQRIPVISWLFSMGALFWTYLFCGALLLYKRAYIYLTALSLPGAVWLTLLLGPTFLPRYTVFLWFLLPWVLHGVFSKKNGEIQSG